MIIIGVDPGVHGGIAVLNEHSKVIMVEPMPVLKSSKGKDIIHFSTAADQIRTMREQWRQTESFFGALEKQQPLPAKMGGSQANYLRGYSMAMFEVIFHMCWIPYSVIRPADWQKVMHYGVQGSDTKQKSAIVAQRLFPDVDLKATPRSKKIHDGMAEALLIAEYIRGTLVRRAPASGTIRGKLQPQ